ncbi:MAG: methyltransferase domain-containing protein [Thermoplasmata archaeon]
MPSWDPQQYRRFEQERALPCRDLIGRIGGLSPLRIVDLGCGTGTSTRLLRERWPAAQILGVDSSPEMIAEARSSGVVAEWSLADIRTWSPDRPVDLVFSNAALQWVGAHDRIFPRLLEHVATGGALAVQMPFNWESPAYRCLRGVVESPTWSSRWGRDLVTIHDFPPAFYYDLLSSACRQVDLWETEYIHVLPDPDAIVEWMKGTGMRPYLDSLGSESGRTAFLREISSGVAASYPPQSDGRVLFAFRRLFLVAYR